MCGAVLQHPHFTCGYSYPHREVLVAIKPVAVKPVSFPRLTVLKKIVMKITSGMEALILVALEVPHWVSIPTRDSCIFLFATVLKKALGPGAN